MSNVSMDLSILDFKNMLNSILINCKKIKYEEADIYFVEEEQFKHIQTLYLSAESLFKKDYSNLKIKYKGKTKDPFYQIAKILNPENKAIAYKTFLKHKYVNITDEVKVKNRIDVEHLIEINEIKKYYSELKEENRNVFTNEKIIELEIEEKERIEHIKRMKKFLIDEFIFLDIRITTFRDDKLYPTIRMIDINGKDIQEYLRLEVPNILNAHKNIFIIEPGYRKDARHIKFVLSAEHAFGQIYFKRKNYARKS